MPNPCLVISEQYFPYAFSQSAYIQCDDDTIHFRPCAPTLYWDQGLQNCNRKRPTKVDLGALLIELSKKKDKNSEENEKETVNEEIKSTGKLTETEQQIPRLSSKFS